jgi:hypothetical protein
VKIGNATLRPVGIGIIILTILTALIHITLAEPLLILNGLGYLALLAALYLPLFKRWQRFVRWVFAGYILLTIVLYFVFHPNGAWQQDGLGLVTKLIELILLLLLIYDGQEGSVEETSSS